MMVNALESGLRCLCIRTCRSSPCRIAIDQQSESMNNCARIGDAMVLEA